MNFQLSQLILISAIFLFILYVFRVRTLVTDRVIYLVLVFGGILLAIFPDLSTWIANLIGIGRGADLILYIFVIFSLFDYVNKASQLKKMKHQITAIVRKIAVDEGMFSVLSQEDTINKNIPVVSEKEQQIRNKLEQVTSSESS